MADTDILVSEMTPATQINTTDLMIMTQPDAQAETGYSTKSGTVLQVANKMLKGTEYSTDLPDFSDKTPLGGLEELKSDIENLLPVDTASGDVANFETALQRNLVSCKCDINASGGGGTPSTPIPIVGYSSLDLVRCGVNLLDKSTGVLQDLYIDTGTLKIKSIGISGASIYLPIAGGATYTVSKVASARFTIATATELPALNSDINAYNSDNTATSLSITTTSADKYLVIFFYLSSQDTKTQQEILDTLQVQVGSQALPYQPYNGNTYPISLGRTVYGGSLDVTSGVLTKTFENDNLADLNWTYSSADGWFQVYHNVHKHPASGALCSYYPVVYTLGADFVDKSIAVVANYLAIKDSSFGGDVNALKTALAGQTLCYELATPVQYQLTPVQVQQLLGVNNVFHNANGETAVEFKDTIQHYIDKKIAQTQALIL